jgi:hypothetical protein
MLSPEMISGTFEQKIIQDVPEQFRKPIVINISPGCEAFTSDIQFTYALHELILNCAEKDIEGIEIMVSISRTDNHFSLTVEDNVIYPENDINEIIRNLNLRKPKRIGKRRDEVSRDKGYNVGIAMARNYFTNRKGRLTYRKTQDNRVIVLGECDVPIMPS